MVRPFLRISRKDRVYHEMRVLVNVFGYGGTYDQINLGALVSMEVVCRRLQSLAEAYDRGVDQRSWDVAQYIGVNDVGDLLTQEQRHEANRKARDKLELDKFRQRAAHHTEEEPGFAAGSVEAGGLPADAPPRGRGGRGSRGRGSRPRGGGA